MIHQSILSLPNLLQNNLWLKCQLQILLRKIVPWNKVKINSKPSLKEYNWEFIEFLCISNQNNCLYQLWSMHNHEEYRPHAWKTSKRTKSKSKSLNYLHWCRNCLSLFWSQASVLRLSWCVLLIGWWRNWNRRWNYNNQIAPYRWVRI